MPGPDVPNGISSFLRITKMIQCEHTILQKLIEQIVRRPCKSRNNFNAFIQLKMKFTDTDNFPHPNLGMVIAEMSRTLEGLCNLRGSYRRREKLHFAKVAGVALYFYGTSDLRSLLVRSTYGSFAPARQATFFQRSSAKQVPIANLELVMSCRHDTCSTTH